MYLVKQITTAPKQKRTLVLPDGTKIGLEIEFRLMQYGWFINSLTYTDASFELNGVRITNSPDILYQWKNKIPFGLACFSQSNREPSQQEDFSSGASRLYILNSDEVDAYTTYLQNG